MPFRPTVTPPATVTDYWSDVLVAGDGSPEPLFELPARTTAGRYTLDLFVTAKLLDPDGEMELTDYVIDLAGQLDDYFLGGGGSFGHTSPSQMDGSGRVLLDLPAGDAITITHYAITADPSGAAVTCDGFFGFAAVGAVPAPPPEPLSVSIAPRWRTGQSVEAVGIGFSPEGPAGLGIAAFDFLEQETAPTDDPAEAVGWAAADEELPAVGNMFRVTITATGFDPLTLFGWIDPDAIDGDAAGSLAWDGSTWQALTASTVWPPA